MLSTPEGATKLRNLGVRSTTGFKIGLILSLVWVCFHVVAYSYLAVAPDPEIRALDFTADYNFYLKSGQILDARGPVYDLISNPFPAFTFKYHPALALLFAWFNKLPAQAMGLAWFAILVAGYLAGIFVWFLLFSRLRVFDWALVGIAALLPLVAYDWLGTFGFGNASPALILFNALLMLCIVDRRPIGAGFCTALLLIAKFYWCFPLIVLVVFKEWRLLGRILVFAFLFYAGLTLLYLLALGDWTYGISTLRDYVTYLTIASSRQPWRGTEGMFESGNHAIYQTIVRYVGFTSWASGLTLFIQLLLVGLLAWLIWKLWKAKISRDNHPEYAFVAAGVCYIVLMCLLPEVNDGMLSAVLCVLLWSMPGSRRWAVLFAPLTLMEIPSLIGIGTGIHWLVLPMTFPLVLVGFMLLLIGSWRLLARPFAAVASESQSAEGGTSAVRSSALR